MARAFHNAWIESKESCLAARNCSPSPLKITDLRLAAERRYRSCAHFAADDAEKIRWVDLANRVRPVTLF